MEENREVKGVGEWEGEEAWDVGEGVVDKGEGQRALGRGKGEGQRREGREGKEGAEMDREGQRGIGRGKGCDHVDV